MTREYWDKVAEDYEGEVLSVFDCDYRGVVCARIARVAEAYPGGVVADLGCGVGKFSSVLARHFKRVEACDFSSIGLENARKQCCGLGGVNFHQVDLAREVIPFEPVDVVLCINVLLMADLDECLRAWRSVTNQVKAGGRLILGVPALESAVMQRHHEVEAHLDEGWSCEDAVQDTLPKHSSAWNLYQGVHLMEGKATRHYLKEELAEMLQAHHFDVEELVRVNYRVRGDAEDLPHWDWLAVARRNRE